MKTIVLFCLRLFSVLLVIIYLLSCTTHYVHPSRFWPFTFLALGFPLLAASLLVFATAWLFFNRRTSLLLLVVLFIGYGNLQTVVALNITPSFKLKKDTTTLRILDWNVKGFDNSAVYAEHPDSIRRRMINYLRQKNADVLMLQEFVEYHNKATYSNIKVLADTLGYRYHYFSRDNSLMPSWGLTEFGCAIFSKLPLLDTGKYLFKNLAVPESVMTALIVFKNQKIRLYTTHLVSMNLKKGILARDDEAFKKYDSAFIYGSSIFTKLKHYDKVHSTEAEEVRKYVQAHPEPAIICGDFNAVSSSYTYKTIRGKMNDAFLQKGFGLGRSFVSLSPTLRIDYIFTDPLIKVVQFSCPKDELSDHYPLITDVQWR